jgi:hypothetical protein
MMIGVSRHAVNRPLNNRRTWRKRGACDSWNDDRQEVLPRLHPYSELPPHASQNIENTCALSTYVFKDLDPVLNQNIENKEFEN